MALELQLSTSRAEGELTKFATTLTRLQSQLNNFNATHVQTALNAMKGMKGIDPAVANSITNLNRQMAQVAQNASNAARAMGQLGQAGRGVGAGVGNASSSLGTMKGVLGALGITTVIGQMRSFVSESINAANKFQTFNNVMTSVRGNSAAAATELDFLRKTADKNGASLEAMVSSYSNFAAASANVGFTAKDTQEIFSNMSGVFRTLNLSTEEQGLAFLALQQMMAKGVVSMEELRRQLGERMPTAFDTMARALGVGQGELSKLIATGQVGSEILLEFSRIAKNDFASGLMAASGSGQASIQRLQNAWFEFQASFGQGFIEGIKPAIDAFTKWFTDGEIVDGARTFGNAVGQAFGLILSAIPPVVGAWRELTVIAAVFAASPIVGFLGSLVAGLGAAAVALNPIGAAIAAAAAAAIVLHAAYKALFGEQTKVASATAIGTTALREQAVALQANTVSSQERVTALQAEKQALVEKLQAELASAQASATQLANIQAMTESEREQLGITDQMVQYLQAKVDAQTKDMVATQGALQAKLEAITAEQGYAASLQDSVSKTQAAIQMEELLSTSALQTAGSIDTQTLSVNNTNTALGGTTTAAQAAGGGLQGFYGIVQAGANYFQQFIEWVGKAVSALEEFLGKKAEAGDVSGGTGASDAGGDTAVSGFRYGGLTNGYSRSSYRVSAASFANAPAFASGTPNTSGGFPAILHANEAVIPLPDGRSVPVSLGGLPTGGGGLPTGGGGNPADTALLSAIVDNSRKTRIATEATNLSIRDTTIMMRGDFAQIIARQDRAFDLARDSDHTLDAMLAELKNFKLKAAVSGASGSGGAGGSGGGTKPTGNGEEGGPITVDTSGGATGGVNRPAGNGPNGEMTQKDWFDLGHGFLPDGWTKTIESAGAGTNGYNITYAIFDTAGNRYNGSSFQGFATGSPNAYDDIKGNGAMAVIHPDEAVIPLPDGRRVPVDLGDTMDKYMYENAAKARRDFRPVKEAATPAAITINMTVNTPDAASFRRSSDQIAQELRTKLDKATKQVGSRSSRDDPTRRPT